MFKQKNKDWFVIQTRGRHEKKVYSLLVRSGIEAYLPLLTRKKRWSDRIKLVEEPLFSGYLFVQYNEKNRYQILNTPGVVRFVSFESQYAIVSSRQMETIKALSNLKDETEVIDLSFVPGEEVLISSGPFKGVEAKLITFKGKDKLLLEVEAIGKGVLLEIGKTKIEKIQQQIAF